MVKNIKFPALPLIYAYIEADYNKANTIEEMVALHFKWIKESETSTNEVKSEAYLSASRTIFEELTGISYQTKIFEQCL